jgi:hypothetical protein
MDRFTRKSLPLVGAAMGVCLFFVNLWLIDPLTRSGFSLFPAFPAVDTFMTFDSIDLGLVLLFALVWTPILRWLGVVWPGLASTATLVIIADGIYMFRNLWTYTEIYIFKNTLPHISQTATHMVYLILQAIIGAIVLTLLVRKLNDIKKPLVVRRLWWVVAGLALVPAVGSLLELYSWMQTK